MGKKQIIAVTEREKMARYIDADALQEHIEKRAIAEPWVRALMNAMVDDEPTADVREIVRGEWEIYDYEYDGEDEHPIIKCSMCGYLPPEEMDTYNFCPNCGADMRGEENG